jgi:hypothetical protein
LRSVFVLLRGTNEAEVAAYLDGAYPTHPKPPWILCGGDGPRLYVRFYRDLCNECDADLIHRLGGEPTVAVMADVSGRDPGDEEVLIFATGLLDRFSGAAMDDYTEHLWSLAELRAGDRVLGHHFFDYKGWYDERRADA